MNYKSKFFLLTVFVVLTPTVSFAAIAVDGTASATISSLADWQGLDVTSFNFSYNIGIYNMANGNLVCGTNAPGSPGYTVPYNLDSNNSQGYNAPGGCTTLAGDADFPTINASFNVGVFEGCYNEAFATCWTNKQSWAQVLYVAGGGGTSTPVTSPTSTVEAINSLNNNFVLFGGVVLFLFGLVVAVSYGRGLRKNKK